MSDKLIWMKTNVRNFLRNFSSFKAKARRGEVVRVQDKDGEFVFTAAGSGKTLLGAATGKINVFSDLADPSLAPAAWKPSL